MKAVGGVRTPDRALEVRAIGSAQFGATVTQAIVGASRVSQIEDVVDGLGNLAGILILQWDGARRRSNGASQPER